MRHPVFGIGVEAGVAGEIAQLAELARGGAAGGIDIIGFEMDAISDTQLPVGRLGGGDHRRAFLGRRGHRLFAQHVLARLERADGIFGVQPDRQDDVDRIDILVVGDAVEIIVIVEFRDAVAGAQVLGLLRIAGDQGGDARAVRHDKARHDLAGGEAAQADDGPVDLLGLRQVIGVTEQRLAGRLGRIGRGYRAGGG